MSENPNKLRKIVNTEKENRIFWTSWKNSIKFSGKMWLMMRLKVTKNQDFTLSLENTFLEGYGGEGDGVRDQTDAPPFLEGYGRGRGSDWPHLTRLRWGRWGSDWHPQFLEGYRREGGSDWPRLSRLRGGDGGDQTDALHFWKATGEGRRSDPPIPPTSRFRVRLELEKWL